MEKLIKDINDSKIFNFEVNENNFFEVYDIYNSYLNCKNCKGISFCKNPSKGYKSTLNGLKKCDYKKELEIIEKKDSNLESMFFSKKLMSSDIKDFDIISQSRAEILKTFTYIITNNISKGMFICGSNATGKTFFISCAANEYKNRGKRVMLAFVPDLIRYLRGIRYSSEIEQKIDELKNIDVLMLDDLGVEIYDPWFAYEVLTPILNYRLQEEKVTFFTSNYMIQEMLDGCPDKQAKDFVRLLRRIESLCIKNNKGKTEFEMRLK